MSMRLFDLLPISLSFPDSERSIRHKIVFLNSVFLMATVVAFGMGFYRWQHSPLMGAIDFIFSFAGLGALYYLKRHHDKVELISTLAIWLAYVLFMALYLLATYNPMRLSLFFLLLAATFYLKGRQIGLRWLFLIVASILGGHVLTGFGTGYALIDIVTTCIYLLALYFIFWNYETAKEAHYQREQQFELQRQVDERWRHALEGAGDAIWNWDLVSHSLIYSRSFNEMLGYDESDLGNSPNVLQRLIHPDDWLAALHNLRLSLKKSGADRFRSESRLRCKDGSYRWILCRGQVQERNAEGRALRMAGTSTDVTDRKLAEQALQVSQQRLHLALDSALMGVWEYDFVSRQMYWSPEVFRLFGLPQQPVSMELLQSLVHPADWPQVDMAMQQAIQERGPFRAEFRLGDLSDPAWVEEVGEIHFAADGSPLRVVGIVQNITERKRTEEELNKSRLILAEERSLFQTILDKAPLGIWMLSADGKMRFINRGFCGAVGIPEERFLQARHYSDLLPLSAVEGCIRSDRECLEQDTTHVSWEWLPFVDGREHLLEITKIKILSPDGGLLGLIGIAMDVTERKEHEKQLEHIAHYDTLTGVPNRVLLADRMKQALARTLREGGLLAVCYLDLDGFKPVNDTYGHETGDHVLVEVTRRIKETIRDDDTVARLGGDEFVVLLVGLQVPEECAGSLNRLLEAINQPIVIDSRPVIHITASIGVALYPEDEQDPDTLLRHADQAMYLAKQGGKNRYHLFDAESDQRARAHHELLQQIRHGLDNGEFELYYQPKVEMGSRRLVGAEALIRWNHPTRGVLPPGEFLRVIENTELEIELGNWVIADAIDQLRRWRDSSFILEVSINVSAYHLQTQGFVDHLRTQAGLCCPGNCFGTLQVEILETTALEDMKGVSTIIEACRDFGMVFALDDFGTGYSSLTYLSNLDVDTLKIDQSFVRHMLENTGDHAIVQGIIALAKAFGRRIVAEGVETEAHYSALQQMGCEAAQGYHIARPMPAAALIEWARRWKAGAGDTEKSCSS